MNSHTAWCCYSMLLALICIASANADSPETQAGPAAAQGAIAADAATGQLSDAATEEGALPLASGPATFSSGPQMAIPVGAPMGPQTAAMVPLPFNYSMPAAGMPMAPPAGMAPWMGPAGPVMPASYMAPGAGAMPGPMGMPGQMPGPMGMPGQMPGPMGMPGQMGPMGAMPGPMGPMGAMQAGAMAPAGAVQTPSGMAVPSGPSSSPYCNACGGVGCNTCEGYGVRGHIDPWNYLRYLLPYSEGGICAPRHFDVHFDVMFLERDQTARSNAIFMSNGPRGLGVPVPALSAGDLDFDKQEGGPRITLAFQIGPGTNIEGSYFGMHNWDSQAAVFDPTDSLYSVYSDFGTFPAPTVGGPPGPPFPPGAPRLNGGLFASDAAQFSMIDYSAEIHSVELTYRKRWLGTNCKLQGSWLAGVRYFQLYEDFGHFISVDYDFFGINDFPFDLVQGFTDYRISTRNALTGFQMGCDIWANIVPGVRIGGELKAGVYGNRATQITRYNFTTINPIPDVNAGVERVTDPADIAFLGEAGIMATWRVNYHWTARVGYQAMHVNGVALALEQFNPVGLNGDPASPPRIPVINDNGRVLMHGATIGFEYIW